MPRQTPSLRTEQALRQVSWNPQVSRADAGFPEGMNRDSGPGAREDPGFRGRNLLKPRRGLFWEILEVFSGTPVLGMHTSFQSSNIWRTLSPSPVVFSQLSFRNHTH